MGGRQRRASLLLLFLSLAPCTAASATLRDGVETVAPHSACDAPPGPLSYRWPVRPFGRPHPVRGNFGDPRTFFHPGGGQFAFHNGVDIVAPVGRRVYPVVSGTVARVSTAEIVVRADDRRIFQYWHLSPWVHEGQWVSVDRTVLGLVQAPYDHVHLTELRDGVSQNPLAPGHLFPYRDTRAPTVVSFSFSTEDGQWLSAHALRGAVRITASAYDLPSLPAPPPWRNFPVAPAELGWRVSTLGGQDVVPERVAVSFMVTEPPNPEFWDVYAKGTRQNFSQVANRRAFRPEGVYRFNLTPSPFDTSLLPPGKYTLTVAAADVCGNTGSLSEAVRVLPQQPSLGPSAPGSLLRAKRVNAWPAGTTGYTVVLSRIGPADGAIRARGIAMRALGRGLRRVGILPLRHRGFYDVFSGLYPTYSYAAVAAARAREFFPRASPRLIEPRATPLARWPKGRTGYTIVLASLPSGDGVSAAFDEAIRQRDRGVPSVGVLTSSDYASLRPHYYVVFSGMYSTQAQARAELERIAALAPGAYIREINSH